MEKKLESLYYQHFKEPCTEIERLPAAGSDRHYWRLKSQNYKAIGAYHKDKDENYAFVEFSKHFKLMNCPVPTVYIAQLEDNIYLQEDLGDTSLLDFLQTKRTTENLFPKEVATLYQKALEKLAHLQVVGAKGLDTSLCIGGKEFDRQSVLWDLEYFKYYFLKAHKVTFDEAALQIECGKLAEAMITEEPTTFLYRDFQARNILIKDNEPYFIDFQGGKPGPVYYDVASLLFQAKAAIPSADKEILLNHYFQILTTYFPTLDNTVFIKKFYYFVLLRCLQTLGSYGFRGLFERRTHFLSSIPYGLENLKWLIEQGHIPDFTPNLKKALETLCSPEIKSRYEPTPTDPDKPLLHLEICSFSYRNGYPKEKSDNGGGYVFDCRGIENPGRYEPYKHLSGLDAPVQEFLRGKTKMNEFVKHILELVSITIEDYISKDRTHLSISFGCTGGQHRSVFAAEQITAALAAKYKLDIALSHTNRENWKVTMDNGQLTMDNGQLTIGN